MRVTRGERQCDVAELIGADTFSVINWERGNNQPMVKYYPAIMSYLGYCPIPYSHPPSNLGESVLLYRKHRGLSQRDVAELFRIDPSTLAYIEKTGHAKSKLVEYRVVQAISSVF